MNNCSAAYPVLGGTSALKVTQLKKPHPDQTNPTKRENSFLLVVASHKINVSLISDYVQCVVWCFHLQLHGPIFSGSHPGKHGLTMEKQETFSVA